MIRRRERGRIKGRKRTLMGVSALVLIKKSVRFLIANINERTIFLWPFNYGPFKRKGLSGGSFPP